MGRRWPILQLQRPGAAPDAGVSALRRAAPADGAVPYVLMHEDATSLIASVGDCMICVVHTLTSASVESLARTMSQLIARHGALRSISIAERKTGSEAVGEHRSAASELVRQYTHSIRGAAVVSEGTGFRATAVRSLVTAIHIAGRASHPTKVFGTVPAALAWLDTKRADLRLDVPRVEQAVAELRARLRTGGEME